jgi:hypothetical protein
MKLWCIINLTCLEPAIGLAELLSKKFGPTCFYSDKDDAVAELFRLQQKYQREEFYLFECIGKVVQCLSNKEAWHLKNITE